MEEQAERKRKIAAGETSLGIEFGSTRIKAVLIDDEFQTIATGSYDWENKLEDGFWTYNLVDIVTGLQTSYRQLKEDVERRYGITIRNIGSIGISAMMHGYMAFDDTGELLVPFRTWRNGTTTAAAEELTAKFHFNIPERWSIAHFYQAILDEEKHVAKVDHFTTLAGFIHWLLTGKKVLGIGDASGMFPIDESTRDYKASLLKQFNEVMKAKGYFLKLEDLLPEVRQAGEDAGRLTEVGATILDQSKNLQPGIPLCPPEGDAGTGMTATNSVKKRTGNVSVGTSVFSMIVLEKDLAGVHPEIDMVTTPSGSPVAMVHANNCSSDINAWVGLFKEFYEAMGQKADTDELFSVLFSKALEADADGGGLLSYGYYSGENITGMEEGRPLFARTPESSFTLPNFMRTHLFSAFGALKIGMDILLKEEDVKIDSILGHGGLFKTPVVGQKIVSASMNTPVSVMDTASEGGAWGIALLAAYVRQKETNDTLEGFLEKRVFSGTDVQKIYPDYSDVEGFEVFMERYKAGLSIEKSAVDHLSYTGSDGSA